MFRECSKPRQLATQSICVVLFEHFSLGSLSAIAEAIRVANYLAGTAAYAMTFASPDGGLVPSGGMGCIETRACSSISPADANLVIICEEENVGPDQDGWDPAFAWWLGDMRTNKVKVCAIGTAIFKIARYGMLNGQRAAVPWFHADKFERRFPHVRARSTLIEMNAPIMTCVGGIATLDFMLHYISQTNGLALAADVADYMVYEGIREPSTAQRPAQKSMPKTVDKMAAEILAIAESDLLIKVSDIAARAKVTRRQLERIYQRNLKCSPGRLVHILRLERSRVLLRKTDKSIREIGEACGFVSQSHFSRCYKDHFGRSPRRDRSGPFRPSDFAAVQHLVREPLSEAAGAVVPASALSWA